MEWYQKQRQRIGSSLIALVTILGTAGSALAQQAPPTPTLKPGPPIWMGYLLTAALLVAVLAVSLMPSKRSHQD